jgi:hypothetical protein
VQPWQAYTAKDISHMKGNTRVKHLDFKTLVFVAWVIVTLVEMSEAAEQVAADRLFRSHIGLSYADDGGQLVFGRTVRDFESQTGFDSSRSWFNPDLHACRPDRWKRARIARDGVEA